MDTPEGSTARVKGPRIPTSIAVLVLGILVAGSGAWMVGAAIWDVIDGPSHTIPGTVRLNLDTGTYIVFERTDLRSDPGTRTGTARHDITLDASQLVVTAPSGQDIPVRNSTPTETIGRGSGLYVAAVEFNSPRAGTYTLRFRDARPGSVIVEHPLGDIFRSNIPWILAIVMGGLIAMGGVILLIVGVVRRSRAKRTSSGTNTMAMATPSTAPAAWYPDPHGQHHLRYWDGQTWTDHTAD